MQFRPRIIVFVLAGVLIACSGGEQQKTASRQPAEQGENTGGKRYSEVVRQSIYVPVRDGTRLAVNIYRPAVDSKPVAEKFPVIFVFTPYRARYRAENGSIVDFGFNEQSGLKGITDYGYILAVADIRGKGASFGHRRGFQDRTEALDGRDLVEWLASRPWSTGKVGMLGCSYLGGATLQTASTAPPSLKAIFTGGADLDKYAFVRRGGITAQFNTRPDEPLDDDLKSLPMDEDPDGTLLSKAVAQHAENTPMAPLWYGMPYRDSVSPLTGNKFWEEVGPYTYLDTLKNSGIAFYFWNNWSDEPAEQMILAAENLGGKAFIGPGTHCQPTPKFDFAGEVRRFFDFHLKGIENGLYTTPRYTYWLENAPLGSEWIQDDKRPGTDVDPAVYYLSSGEGSDAGNTGCILVNQLPETASSEFQVDYDLGKGEYFSFWPEPQDEHGLTFTTPPMDHPMVFVGFPTVYLNISVDRKDANVFAYLEEVDATGKVEVISFGRLAASHRSVRTAPYDNLGRPWHSGLAKDIEPVIPGEQVMLNFALLPNARVIQDGSRLRLTVTGADPRQRNLTEIRESPPPVINIHFGGNVPSKIEIPLAPAETVFKNG